MRSNRITVRFERENRKKNSIMANSMSVPILYKKIMWNSNPNVGYFRFCWRFPLGYRSLSRTAYRSMLLNWRWLCCSETFDTVWRYFGCHSWGHSWHLVEAERILLKSHSGQITPPPGQELTGQNVNISRAEKLGSTLISEIPRTNHCIFFFSFLGSLSIKDS